MTGRRTLAPDDLPRSKSGRLPNWVIEEASGRAVEAPAWRAASGPVVVGGSRRRRWVTRALGVALLAGVLGVALVAEPPHWFSLAVPDDPNAPPPGFEEAAQPLGTPPAVGTGGEGKYQFVSTTDGAEPVTWSPCRPIHYVVRPGNAPAHGAAMIAKAVTGVSEATG